MSSFLSIIIALGIFFVHLSSAAAIQGRNRLGDHQSRHHHSYSHSLTSSTVATPAPVIATFSKSLTVTGIPTALPSSISNSTGDDGDDDDESTSALAGGEAISTSTSSFYTKVASNSAASLPLSSIENPIASGSASTPVSSPSFATSASVAQITATPSPSSTGSGTFWSPGAGASWQIQLTNPVTDTSLAADIFDIDLFDNDATTIGNLHSSSKKVICYFSAGTYEDWRPDATSFTASDKGSAMDDWPGEWWLNTNSANVRTIMTARIDLAKTKGCDGVDPDNVDAYDNANGVGLTEDNAVDYLTFLADAAHSRGLSIGLKNAGGLVDKTLPMMEWQVNEQCVEFDECNLFQPFIDANKPVFHIEYPDDAPNVATDIKTKDCGVAGFSSVMKNLALDAWVDPCQ